MKHLQIKLFPVIALTLAAGYLVISLAAGPARASSRIRDITDFEGVRANLLIGYGLVVGHNRTGDSLNNSIFTQQSLVSMLARLGVNTRGTTLVTQNVAAVMVTATMPAFSRRGTRLDVSVSSLGDATHAPGDAAVGRGWRSLRGGARAVRGERIYRPGRFRHDHYQRCADQRPNFERRQYRTGN